MYSHTNSKLQCSIHMAFIIAFSNLWGIAFREWRGTSVKTKTLVWGGILT